MNEIDLTDEELEEAVNALLLMRGTFLDKALPLERKQAELEILRHPQHPEVEKAIRAGKLVVEAKKARAKETH